MFLIVNYFPVFTFISAHLEITKSQLTQREQAKSASDSDLILEITKRDALLTQLAAQRKCYALIAPILFFLSQEGVTPLGKKLTSHTPPSDTHPLFWARACYPPKVLKTKQFYINFDNI